LTASPSRLIRVGRVAGAFGVRGEVRISTYTQEPLAIAGYGALLREDGAPAIVIKSARAAKDGVIAWVEGIADKDAADALRGLVLFVDRDRLPEPEEDEFYLADLIGLAAVSPQGEALGKVRQVHDFGAGDLIEIQPDQGATWLVAFTREAVPMVDIAGGKIIVVRPAEISEHDPD